MSTLNQLWTDMINFYLDGVSFYYKSNSASQARAPTGRIWRKKSEGLIGCTTKGKKKGNGGKVVNILVAIGYKKGAIDCEQYANMNGQFFKNYVHHRFPATFEGSKGGLALVDTGWRPKSELCCNLECVQRRQCFLAIYSATESAYESN